VHRLMPATVVAALFFASAASAAGPSVLLKKARLDDVGGRLAALCISRNGDITQQTANTLTCSEARSKEQAVIHYTFVRQGSGVFVSWVFTYPALGPDFDLRYSNIHGIDDVTIAALTAKQ
jgi:hypothetical protein